MLREAKKGELVSWCSFYHHVICVLPRGSEVQMFLLRLLRSMLRIWRKCVVRRMPRTRPSAARSPGQQREEMSSHVLVFPPCSNYRRYLVHRACEPLHPLGLTTFSIGAGEQRRTVLCYESQILSHTVGTVAEAMGVDKTRDNPQGPPSGPPGPYRPPHARRLAPSSSSSSETPVKTRRPDREVYVPRARRSHPPASVSVPAVTPTSTPADAPASAPANNLAATPTAGCPRPSSRKVADRSYCNVYRPPHARVHSDTSPQSEPTPGDTVIAPGVTLNCYVTNCEYIPSIGRARRTVPTVSDHSSLSGTPSSVSGPRDHRISEDGVNGSAFVAADPGYNHHVTYDSEEHVTPSLRDRNFIMEPDTPDHLFDNDNIAVQSTEDKLKTDSHNMWNNEKDEDKEQKELKRASQEINRSNRRLIKQSFDSDVLIISEAVLERQRSGDNIPDDSLAESEIERAKEATFNPEEEDWEAMLDENGECLEPSLLAELTAAVGRVAVQQPRAAPRAPYEHGTDRPPDPFSHVLEVYNFPPEFKEIDLLSVFSDFKDTGFEIKWVDDNHALIVFSSTKIAQEVLAYSHPLVRTRPLHEATQESRQKARKCAEFLQPYRPRPETCAALARRLVTGALGVRLSTASQERVEERRLLTQAREKKRLAAQHREAAWDGSLADSSNTS